jgi:hypothetical protein
MSNTLKFGNGEWYGKEGTILAYNDENNNYKPLPFTFDRDSVATRVNKQGLIETVGADQPRIDYLNDSNGALLLEPSRTNLITNSQGSVPILVNVTQVTNNSISPDGSNNSTLITSNTTNAAHYFGFSNTSVTSGISYTGSVFVKKGTGRYFQLLYGSGGFSTTKFINFDLEIGTIVYTGANTSGNIEAIGKNGWYRLSISATADSTTTETMYCGIVTSGTSVRLKSHESILTYSIYGAMLEEGSYATSYIPTQGSAVTRLAETCNNSGNEQVINSTEGVLYAEMSGLANDGTNRRITISNGGVGYDVGFRFNNVSNQIQVVSYINSSVVVNESYVLPDITVIKKYALKWGLNNYALWVNGVEVITDTSAVSFPIGTLNTLNFASATNTSNFYGNVKDIRVYNEALSDSELAALTQV